MPVFPIRIRPNKPVSQFDIPSNVIENAPTSRLLQLQDRFEKALADERHQQEIVQNLELKLKEFDLDRNEFIKIYADLLYAKKRLDEASAVKRDAQLIFSKAQDDYNKHVATENWGKELAEKSQRIRAYDNQIQEKRELSKSALDAIPALYRERDKLLSEVANLKSRMQNLAGAQ